MTAKYRTLGYTLDGRAVTVTETEPHWTIDVPTGSPAPAVVRRYRPRPNRGAAARLAAEGRRPTGDAA
jgi:hypothetical protein